MKIGKTTVYVPQGSRIRKKSLVIANALTVELLNFGYGVDMKIHNRISSLKPAQAKIVAETLSKEYASPNLNPPLFNDWELREAFSLGEFVVQILAYTFRINGNHFESESFFEDLLKNVEYKKLKGISLASDEDFKTYFKNLTGARVAMDRQTSQKLTDIFEVFSDEVSNLPRMASAEMRMAALLAMSNKKGLTQSLRDLKCDTNDVLRYAAAKKDFETFKLPSNVLFASLKWADRVAILTFLNERSLESTCEAMGQNRGAWAKFLKHIHMFGQKGFKDRFHNFYKAAYVSLGNRLDAAPEDVQKGIKDLISRDVVDLTPSGTLAYRTFASRFDLALKNKNTVKLAVLIEQNAGYAFRNLTKIVNAFDKKQDTKDVVKALAAQIDKVNASTLFSIIQIGVDSKYRVIDVKGQTKVEEANYPVEFKKLQKKARKSIQKRFGFEGKVKASKAVKGKVVPFLVRNAEMQRGMRVPVDKKYVYIFTHWIQNGHTDLDLSAVVMDKDFNQIDKVSFSAQANRYMTHSGDFTSAPAPNGSTEYIKIRKADIPIGARYITAVTNIYSGGKDFGSCCAVAQGGVLVTDSEHFTLSNETVKFDLIKEASVNAPFVYDVATNELVLVDYNICRTSYGQVDQFSKELGKVISASETSNNLTIGELAKMLSGDGDDVSLTIKENDNSDGVISPENLFSLFS